MKLCRFELVEEPGRVRTGLFYDNRVYETDGQNALGVHDLTKVRFHPPTGQAPVLRAFDWARGANGEESLSYSYKNPSVLIGPLGEIEAPVTLGALDFQVRVCGLIQDSGRQIDRSEAPSFILGYALLICPFSPTDLEAELARGGSGTVATDVSPALGPFVVTPEELAEYGVSGEPTAFQSTYEIKVNEEVVGKGNWQSHCSFVELLQLSSISSPVTSGEIIAFPPLAQSPLIETSFGRELLPGDKVSATVEGFGTLVVRIG